MSLRRKGNATTLGADRASTLWPVIYSNPCTSLTGFTQESGTWTIESSYITQTDTTATFRQLLIPVTTSATYVGIEVDAYIDSPTSAGYRLVAVSVHNDSGGPTNGTTWRIGQASSGTGWVGQMQCHGVGDRGADVTYSPSTKFGDWHTLRYWTKAYTAGGSGQVGLTSSGSFTNSTAYTSSMSNASNRTYARLLTYGCKARFRNLTVMGYNATAADLGPWGT